MVLTRRIWRVTITDDFFSLLLHKGYTGRSRYLNSITKQRKNNGYSRWKQLPSRVSLGSCGKAVYSSTFHFSTLLVHSAVPGTATTSLAHTCMTYLHDKEHIPLLRGTFRAWPLERLNFVESRATDENFARNLGISQIGLLNRCVSSVV